MRVGRKLALLVALAAATTVLPMVSANAATTYTVQMGFGVPHGFSTRVLAPSRNGIPTIDIGKNDIVDFKNGAGLLPDGVGPFEWASDNTVGLDAPYGFIASDPDADLQEPFPTDAPYKCNICVVPATHPGCGDSAANACKFDGSELMTPGDTEATGGHFYVEFTGNPGDTFWGMGIQQINRQSVLRINIVTTGFITQVAIDEAAAAISAEEKDTAAALYAKLNATSTKHKTRSGQVIHDAYVGYDTNTIALFDMFPSNVVVHKGEKVRWHFSQLAIELHGVAFPKSAALNIANNGFIPVCDPDTDSGEGPDTFTVDFETFTCPPADGELELDLSRELTAENGDGRFPGGSTKVENSGLRGLNIPSAPDLAGGGGSWDLIFTKVNLKGYKYICTVHGREMLGKVTVKS